MTTQITSESKIALFLTGWFIFPFLFMVQQWFWFNTKAGKQIISTYGFSPKDCSDISCKVVSAFQAILASISGFIICFNCYEDVLYDSHPVTEYYAWLGIPYFIYDTFVMFYISRMPPADSKQRGNIVTEFFKFVLRSPVIVIHHMILAPLGFSLISFCRDGIRNGDFIIGVVYLMETSTPFVSFRYILSKLKLKSSTSYIVNGVSMLISFPVFRIFTAFYTVGMYAKQNGFGYMETLCNIPFGWKIVFAMAIAPQIYWYYLMCNGLIKMIRKSQWEKKEIHERESLSASTENKNQTDVNGASTRLKNE